MNSPSTVEVGYIKKIVLKHRGGFFQPFLQCPPYLLCSLCVGSSACYCSHRKVMITLRLCYYLFSGIPDRAFVLQYFMQYPSFLPIEQSWLPMLLCIIYHRELTGGKNRGKHSGQCKPPGDGWRGTTLNISNLIILGVVYLSLDVYQPKILNTEMILFDQIDVPDFQFSLQPRLHTFPLLSHFLPGHQADLWTMWAKIPSRFYSRLCKNLAVCARTQVCEKIQTLGGYMSNV